MESLADLICTYDPATVGGGARDVKGDGIQTDRLTALLSAAMAQVEADHGKIALSVTNEPMAALAYCRDSIQSAINNLRYNGWIPPATDAERMAAAEKKLLMAMDSLDQWLLNNDGRDYLMAIEPLKYKYGGEAPVVSVEMPTDPLCGNGADVGKPYISAMPEYTESPIIPS